MTKLTTAVSEHLTALSEPLTLSPLAGDTSMPITDQFQVLSMDSRPTHFFTHCPWNRDCEGAKNYYVVHSPPYISLINPLSQRRIAI
jgi:hypothetical protein